MQLTRSRVLDPNYAWAWLDVHPQRPAAAIGKFEHVLESGIGAALCIAERYEEALLNDSVGPAGSPATRGNCVGW
jgi:hypothetical protein